jgi:hypothetical protein
MTWFTVFLAAVVVAVFAAAPALVGTVVKSVDAAVAAGQAERRPR